MSRVHVRIFRPGRGETRQGRAHYRPGRTFPRPLDRVNRRFAADCPNPLWVSDFTHVSTWQGWLYVAFVIDVYARRIVGWRMRHSRHGDRLGLMREGPGLLHDR